MPVVKKEIATMEEMESAVSRSEDQIRRSEDSVREAYEDRNQTHISSLHPSKILGRALKENSLKCVFLSWSTVHEAFGNEVAYFLDRGNICHPKEEMHGVSRDFGVDLTRTRRMIRIRRRHSLGIPSLEDNHLYASLDLSRL